MILIALLAGGKHLIDKQTVIVSASQKEHKKNKDILANAEADINKIKTDLAPFQSEKPSEDKNIFNKFYKFVYDTKKIENTYDVTLQSVLYPQNLLGATESVGNLTALKRIRVDLSFVYKDYAKMKQLVSLLKDEYGLSIISFGSNDKEIKLQGYFFGEIPTEPQPPQS